MKWPLTSQMPVHSCYLQRPVFPSCVIYTDLTCFSVSGSGLKGAVRPLFSGCWSWPLSMANTAWHFSCDRVIASYWHLASLLCQSLNTWLANTIQMSLLGMCRCFIPAPGFFWVPDFGHLDWPNTVCCHSILTQANTHWQEWPHATFAQWPYIRNFRTMLNCVLSYTWFEKITHRLHRINTKLTPPLKTWTLTWNHPQKAHFHHQGLYWTPAGF